MKNKLLLIGGIILAVVVFYASGFNEYLTFETLKASQAEVIGWRDANPIIASLTYFVIYVVVTAISLPGAAILTLAGGAFFGLFWGLILVSFASSIGATCAFLVARYLFRDTIQHKFSQRLDSINKGVEREGGFYLFSLRLVPLFPFFVINLVMGLTKLPTRTFYWVSQLGMLPGTFVYVNAGTQLADIDGLSGLLSPSLLLSFVLLGLFPLIAKKILDAVKARKVYEGFTKPKQFDQNMIVIGAGAGGLVTAYISAVVKAKVTLIEAHKMGGDCLNTGCVPSKAIIKSAKVMETFKHSKDYGIISGDFKLDFKAVMARVNNTIKTIEPKDSVERYTDMGVNVIKGYAQLIDPWTVEIAGSDGQTQRMTAKSIVLATGAEPLVPPIKGIADSGFLTSDTMWAELSQRDAVPKRLIVLGGGPIGSELAQSFARLGADVTLVERAHTILSREDTEISKAAGEALMASGVALKTGHCAEEFTCEDGIKKLRCSTDEGEVIFEFDDIICALGRKARLDGYGLDNLGIDVGQVIQTNDYLETKFPNIFAVGDVAGPYQFTHTAAHQAWFAAVNGLFGTFKKFKVDYRVIPWTTFIDPEVARVGLNEMQAKEQNIAYEVTKYGLDDLDRAIADGSDYGVVKVLTVPGKDTILGVTIFGVHAGDLMAEFVFAMKHNLGLNKILGTIHTYPTLAEANKFAAGEWKKAHSPQWAMKYLQKFHQWRRGGTA